MAGSYIPGTYDEAVCIASFHVLKGFLLGTQVDTVVKAMSTTTPQETRHGNKIILSGDGLTQSSALAHGKNVNVILQDRGKLSISCAFSVSSLIGTNTYTVGMTQLCDGQVAAVTAREKGYVYDEYSYTVSFSEV